jgi:hypothetical protein
MKTASRESDEEQEEKGAKKKAKRRNKKNSVAQDSQEGAPPAEEFEEGPTDPKFKDEPEDKRLSMVPTVDLTSKIKKKKKLKYDQIKQLDADDLFSYITGDTPKEDGKKQQKSREKRIQS